MKYPILSKEKTRCQLCGKEMKMINNTHLKSHNISIDEYKNLFPNSPTMSEELSIKFTERSIKSNSSRKGIKRSQEEKDNISKGIKKKFTEMGYVVHNKNKKMSETQKEKLSKRHLEKYENGYINPLKGTCKTDEQKKQMSINSKQYAQNNKEEIKARAIKAVKTKKENGYYLNKKIKTIETKIEKYNQYNFTVISHDNYQCQLQCNICHNEHTRTFDSMIHDNMCPGCRNIGSSKAEKEIAEFISSFGLKIEVNNKSILNGFELDIIIPELKIAIEFDGLYWHSEKMGKGKFYHLTKTNKSLEKGYKLIHVFEDEWNDNKDLVKSRLRNLFGKNNQKVFARKCKIKELTNYEVKDFYNQNHIQGHFNSTINLGLFFDNKLVSAMSFSKANASKGQKKFEYDYELSRFCSESNTNVIGGANKLFSYFIKKYDPSKILSYSDKRWNNGNIYGLLGFENVGSTLPGYWYCLSGKRYHRYKFIKQKLIEQGHDPNKTEKEIMIDLGYDIIWDCGHSKWIWIK